MRRWFQIHLSTAVVLMFVAGTLVGFAVLYFNRNRPSSDTDGALEGIVTIWNYSGKMASVYVNSDPQQTRMADRTPFELDPHYSMAYRINMSKPYKVLELRYYFDNAINTQTLDLKSMSSGQRMGFELLPDGSIRPARTLSL